MTGGIWTSGDGRILAEHGHQIGADVNRYDEWPTVTRSAQGAEYLIRTWGERFVQRLFNEQEREYPIIDNLGPESAGARYRMADRGLWKSVADVARFLRFNLFETSGKQATTFLGNTQGGAKPVWDLAKARKMGHQLLANALPAGDPFRNALLENTEQALVLRGELDSVVQTVSDDEVRLLCDHVAVQAEKTKGSTCAQGELGYSWSRLSCPESGFSRNIFSARLKEYRGMRVFVYAHTHMLESEWRLPLTDPFHGQITVLNTGASSA